MFEYFQKTDRNWVTELDFGHEGQHKEHKIPSGIYQMYKSQHRGPYLRSRNLTHDKLVRIEGSAPQRIKDNLTMFWSDKVIQAYKRYEMMHRRGILLYGVPGTGKTSMFMQVAHDFIAENEHHNVVFIDPDPYDLAEFVEYIREVDKKSKFLVILEEFEYKIFQDESGYLSLLDGEQSMDGIVYLASTNYIEKVPPRFKNRPSRFADVIEVGPPEESVRRTFIQTRMPPEDLEKINLNEWVDKTDGLVLDHIKDLFISVHCLGLNLDSALDKIRLMKELEAQGKA